MKKIILILLLTVTFLQAEFSISGKSSTWYANYKKEMVQGEDKTSDFYTTNLQLNVDYKKDNFYFQSTLFGYIYDTESGKEMQSANYYKGFEKKDLFFRSLYMSYKVTPNFSVGAGVLPFSNSAPIKYNDDYIQDGEGINILNDAALTSAFLKYEIENSRTIVGIGTQDDILVPLGNYLLELVQEDSYTAFIINTYTKDKLEFVSEFLYTNMKYETIELSEIYLLGFSAAWDDSEESGYSVYGAIGGSIYDNHNTKAKGAIYSNTLGDKAAYGDYISAQSPDNFAIENKKYYGGSHLLGARKDFSIGREEFFINAEWFHTYGDWSSGNQGNIYLPKNNQMYNIRDDSYYLNAGYIINNDAQFRVSYTYLEFEEMGKIGAPAVTVPSEDFIGKGFYKAEIIRVIFTYKF